MALRTIPAPPCTKEQLEQDLSTMTRAKIAEKYGVEYHHVTRWIKYLGIVLKPYQGRRITTAITKYSVEEVKEILTSHTKTDAMRILGVTKNGIKRFCKEHDFHLTNVFREMEKEREAIKELLPEIKNLHQSKPLNEISVELGISYQQLKRVRRETNLFPIVSHSYNKSKGEKEVLEFLRTLCPDFKSIKKQHAGKLRELDCYSESLSLAVEYCGEYWHDGINHREKYLWCKEQGISLITIFAYEWETKKDLLCSMLRVRCGVVGNRINARDTYCQIVKQDEAKTFIDNNHIAGWTRASLNLGLFHKNTNDLLSVISFSKNRLGKMRHGAENEIIRFCTERDTIVVGGLSKLLSHARKEHNINSIMTFADLRFGEGRSYEKVGFMYSSDSQPNYKYFNKRTRTLYCRQHFQKHKLEKLVGGLLSTFDPTLTEKENMSNNGYLRLVDCGNALFTFQERGTQN